MNYLTAILDDNGQVNLQENVIIEKEISDGRVNISSISNWDSLTKNKKSFNIDIKKDFKFIRTEIKLLRQQIGYNNLSLEEKIICNRYFCSGVEYNNPEVSQEEQELYYYSYKEGMNKSRQARDLSVSAYLFKQVYTGQISKSDIDIAIKDSQPYRDTYLRDGIEGIGYGDTQKGIINFVKDDLINYSGFNQQIIDDTLDIYVNGNY